MHRALTPWLQRWLSPKQPVLARLWFWFRVVFFFQLVCISWLLFRAESLGQVLEMTLTVVTDRDEACLRCHGDRDMTWVREKIGTLKFQL